MQTMIDAFKALTAQPKIYLCYPSKAYQANESINDDIIDVYKRQIYMYNNQIY